ncbi:MAG: hypothetical protein ACP5G0_09455 [Desulfomonilia bacterium]
MGTDHQKTDLLNCLKAWQGIITKQADAIAHGRLGEFTDLTRQSFAIQARIENLLAHATPSANHRDVLLLLRELSSQHLECVQALKECTDALKGDIARLRKNKTSLMGYKQHASPKPRFMSERT